VLTPTVQPGEGLLAIAVRYGVSAEDIALANQIASPDLIYVGQTLIIPGQPIPRTTTSAPSGTPLPSSTPTPRVTYTVLPGDTLTSVASQYHLTVAELAAANNLRTTDFLYVGQVLIIPQPGVPIPTQSPLPARTHVVQPGETLLVIAVQYGVTVQAIMQANGIANPDYVYAGQVLIIP